MREAAAHPARQGQLATGIVFTALGGMAALTGITLTSIGCRDGGGGLCRSGLTTGGIGLGAVGGGVWLLVDALPEVQVRPIFEPQLALQLSPTGIRGRF